MVFVHLDDRATIEIRARLRNVELIPYLMSLC